jgi:hypothetical protein
MRFGTPIRTAAAVAVLLLSSACASSGVRQPADGPGAAAPGAAVERFMHLIATQDYIAMGWVFGTDRGPIIRRDPPRDVERRMALIANVMKHDRFAVGSQRPVPGRIGGAFRFDVTVTNAGRDHVVPFTAVRGPGNRWFIEDVALDVITTR